jgi:hypothetical protein
MIRIPHGKNATKLDQCESAVMRVAGARNHQCRTLTAWTRAAV